MDDKPHNPDEEMHKQLEEHLREEEQDHHHERRAHGWPPWLIRTFSLTVLILFVSLSFVGIVDVGGLIRSSTVADGVGSDGIEIIFAEHTLELLREEYLSNQEREIKACLYGEIQGNKYILSSIEFPEVLSSSVSHITTEGCSDNALVDLHSHPWYQCSASNQDRQNFIERKKVNPNLLMVIMCSTDRFSVYS